PAAVLLLAIACTTPDAAPVDVEAISLLGDTLRRPQLTDTVLAHHRVELDSARARYAADTASADALIWLGRRTAYLGRYREAIDIFSDGIARFPDDPRFL